MWALLDFGAIEYLPAADAKRRVIFTSFEMP
jgi:hypothetical protein